MIHEARLHRKVSLFIPNGYLYRMKITVYEIFFQRQQKYQDLFLTPGTYQPIKCITLKLFFPTEGKRMPRTRN